ncbi:hypothetical protein C8R44DRAFT_623675, partial [Mycena epipterygia]
VDINGHKAFTLFDSGCTTEAISPDFCQVANICVFPIESEVVLQLGMAGSRSKINHGATARVTYSTLVSEEYVDIVNLDRYDAIVGTRYMRKHGISHAIKPRRRCLTMTRTAAVRHSAELKADGAKLTEEDIPRLRDRWMEISKDIMSGVPETMPPLRAVNHRIPLIDDKKIYNYHLPKCPDSMKDQLLDKINRYVRAGWWTAVQTDQAAPMLCIPKKTGLLRTAIDCRKRNEIH